MCTRPATLMLVFLCTVSARTEPTWRTLFNGSDFTGWTFDVLDGSSPETIWQAKDGVLTAHGQGKAKSVIRTESLYADYELRLAWRWPADPGNSGCLVHCSTPRNRSVWPRSLEIQLQNGNAGDFVTIGEEIEVPEARIPKVAPTSWEVRRRLNLTDGSERPAGDWNELRIEARDRSITVHVNGERVNQGWNCTTNAGAICLQSERSDVQFRNIRIRNLGESP